MNARLQPFLDDVFVRNFKSFLSLFRQNYDTNVKNVENLTMVNIVLNAAQ